MNILKFYKEKNTAAYKGDTYIADLYEQQYVEKKSGWMIAVMALCAGVDLFVFNDLAAQIFDKSPTDPLMLILCVGLTIGYLACAASAALHHRRYKMGGLRADKRKMVTFFAITLATVVTVTGFRLCAEIYNAEQDAMLASMRSSLNSSTLGVDTRGLSAEVYIRAIFTTLLITIAMVISCTSSYAMSYRERDARLEQLWLSESSHIKEDQALYQATYREAFDSEEARNLQRQADEYERAEHRLVVELAREGLRIDAASDPADLEEMDAASRAARTAEKSEEGGVPRPGSRFIELIPQQASETPVDLRMTAN